MEYPTIGIDAGAAYVKIAVLSSGEVDDIIYTPHKSDPLKVIEDFLTRSFSDKKYLAAITGYYSGIISQSLQIKELDQIQTLLAYLNRFSPDAEYALNVGAKGSRLIELKNGKFKNFSQNSLCAAGTGSFLDQQMNRLGLNYSDLENYPFVPNPPRIAARCSVFAKTDLIHRQQEGYSKPEMWNGLCRGMTATLVQTLLRGRELDGKKVLTGGIALNKWVVEWLKRDLGNLELPPHAHMASAIGTAILAADNSTKQQISITKVTENDTEAPSRPELKLEKSNYPSFALLDEWIDTQGTEVRVNKKANSGNFSLGLDIGSTSTKAVLLDEQGDIVADFYRKTSGDPIAATTALFTAIGDFSAKYHLQAKITSAGTTGSGRKMVGLIIGADAIVNEITCHARGALKLDPEIQTIFEIGGQDSKYIRLEGGNIVESNLNYICAAGTGSFVEEQAARLGIKLSQSGPSSLGKFAPYTSDRCTVFMEEDVERLLSKGFSKEEVMAAVLYSVVQNYLTKVVESRSIKPKIAFQGATARNIGLVAAFEQYLGEEIVVSPHCHVLGAYGAALIAAEQVGERSKFRGLDLRKRKIQLIEEECSYCNNHCTITYADVEGLSERPSWGYMCGKEPGEHRKRKEKNYRLFEQRQAFLNEGDQSMYTKKVGIPMVLGFYTYLPFWKGFFNHLGYKVVTSGITTEETIQKGGKLASADFCLPVKVAYGHMAKLLDINPDYILLPHMLIMDTDDYYSHVCPYGQMFPALLQSIPGIEVDKILSPILDSTWAEKENIKELNKAIGKKLGIPPVEIKQAWEAGWKRQDNFKKNCIKAGEKALAELSENAIVLLGRPYSLYDTRISSSLARQIAANLKMLVIPPEFIPPDSSINWQEHRMFWDYGQKILNALKYASKHPKLFPVYITHFACGPDSCIITMAEEVMKSKPYMILEVDEHSSSTGYTTRIEAFAESIRSYKSSAEVSFALPVWKKNIPSYLKRKVWVPLMHPAGSRFFASVFRRHRIDAQALEETDREALNIGKALTLGKECIPAVVTIGSFVKKLREDSLEPAAQAFFMPSSDGPCRFGQYVNLHRIILDREGYKDVAIINPSSYNSYAGLTQQIRLDLWQATLYSDFLVKLRCKVKPYEKNQGETTELFLKSIKQMEQAIEAGNHQKQFTRIVNAFASIPRTNSLKKPLVGIVGEIYVRCDPFSNEGLIDYIESLGAEVWLSPASEFLLYSTYSQNLRAKRQKDTLSLISGKATAWITASAEHRLQKTVRNLLHDRIEPSIAEIHKKTEPYLPFECGTESVLTLGRAIIFAEQGASIVVNVSPFTCMPGTVTAALFEQIQTELGIPIVNMFYDGEEGTNERLGVYLRNL